MIARLAPLVLLLAAVPAGAAEAPPIEPVYGVMVGEMGVTVRVASNGCTHKTDLATAVAKGRPRPILLVARRHPDVCKTPGQADITYGWAELGLKPDQAFSLANPLVASPAGAAGPASAAADKRLCQKLEVDAVAAPGKGDVRVLGPEGMLDLDTPPLVASGEATGAEAGVDGGQNVVRVALTPAAAQRLLAWTAAHKGARLAILLEGQVIRIGDVSGPVGANGLEIGGMARAQAVSMAAGVAACGG